MSARAAVIVQARAGSSRLPGKVLKELNGQTVLRRVLERCAVIDGVDCVCCAVPAGGADDCVAAEASRCGAIVTRGSEHDVLNRYYEAARQLGAAVVMRVTSDCPLLDPTLAAEVLRLVTHDGAGYACNNLPRSWPHGLDCEAFPFECLEQANREAALPFEREHVTPFLRNHPAIQKSVVASPDARLAQHRWTLDTQQDLQFLRLLFARMPEGGNSYRYTVPLSIIENDPQLLRLSLPAAVSRP